MRRINFFIGVVVVLLAVVFLVFLFSPKGKVKESPKVSKHELIKQAEQALAENEPVKAKTFYRQVMAEIEDVQLLEKIRRQIETINIDIIFSKTLDDCSIIYEVQANDMLVKIAKRFGTTVNLIKRANALDSDIIHPGDKLKVNTCKFFVVVDKSQNRLYLQRGNEVIKTYIVSTGKDNSSPVGDFTVVNKLQNPTWFKTGAVIPPNSEENILGTRWIGIEAKGYGIHGTNDPANLGKQVTLGCVRMENKEVEELYDIIPVGSEVTIVD
ncbi:MAG: L,D-transpeptidase family protein [Candidatus Omnitrophica bacterium]|nr:L,D-transpeptidase family protein [Candidatus Omnitrophota bacterium]